MEPVDHCFDAVRRVNLLLKIGKDIKEPVDVRGDGLGSLLAELSSFLKGINRRKLFSMVLEEQLLQLRLCGSFLLFKPLSAIKTDNDGKTLDFFGI